MVLSLPPSVNALYTNQAYYNRKTKSYVSTGKRILTKKGRELKNIIAFQAREQMNKVGWDKVDKGFVRMDAVIYFNRKGRDSDNVYKALQDSLEGIVYENDSQVLGCTKKVLIDRNSPRVEVVIYPVEFVGVFDSSVEAKDFEENCKDCTRYLEGRCSILQDSVEGVVREEVQDKVCTKFKKRLKKD